MSWGLATYRKLGSRVSGMLVAKDHLERTRLTIFAAGSEMFLLFLCHYSPKQDKGISGQMNDFAKILSSRHCDGKMCGNTMCQINANWNSSDVISVHVDWRGVPLCTRGQNAAPDGACRRFAFVHIPKAGGSSIASAIYASELLTHLA